MSEQGRILDELARTVDAGNVRTNASTHFGAINAANLKKAHAQFESGTTIGKVVLEGFI